MGTKANLKIDQGTDFSTSITLTDDDGNALNLSGYTGAGQIRKYYTSTTAVNFDVAVTANTGTVTLELSSNTSNSMNSGRYVYDIELTDTSGIVSRIMEGIVTITPGVTR
jgi:endoglucanase Acf2